jgi:hypothetical protein
MKQQTKHTPGPWKVYREKIKDRIRPVTEVWNQNTFVASLDSKLFDTAEVNGQQQANASLIAAAPEMLSALLIAHTLLEQFVPKGNCYLERGIVDRALCKALGLDYETVKTVDFEAAILKAKGGA